MGKYVYALRCETLSVGKALTKLLRAGHRRPRTADLLASAAAVEHDINHLCVSVIDFIPRPHKNLSTSA